jgi:DNA-binding winged helix-turn-helix (wHTH) protein
MANGGGFVYRFGPYQLDVNGQRLLDGPDIVSLPPREMAVLRLLVDHAGRVVTREHLIEAVWGNTPITDNRLDRTISDIRKAIDPRPDGTSRIQSVKGQGYRFAARVERVAIAEASVVADVLAMRKVQLESRAALDTWTTDAMARTPQQIEAALCDAPEDAALYIEASMAYALRYESTRDDAAPDFVARDKALAFADEGVRLAPASAEGWATLGFAHGLHGHTGEAVNSCNEAIAREEDNWRHWIRIGHAWWAEDRIRAATRVLALASELPVALWLAATVLIARQVFPEALDRLVRGCAAQDAQPVEGGRFTMVGLHLLHGLVLLAMDRTDEALDQFRRELSSPPNQIYARECFANAHYAIGAAHHRLGRDDDARASFLMARTFIPGHGRATAGLAVLSGATEITERWHAANPVDDAIVRAIPLACAGQHAEAEAIVMAALQQAPPGQSGWQLPVEPLLHVQAHPHIWSRTLARITARAL